MTTVLIVDDEPNIRSLIEQALEDLTDEGIEIVTASDGDEAIEVVRAREPRLVFLDVMMPKRNGFDVCRAIKTELGLPDTFVVMLTARGQSYDRKAGADAGADLYLTKPFDPDALLGHAREALGLGSTEPA
jgi:two-component system, OmpR family, alkaline phosphatase synthesis response regulator PhoP